MFPLLFVFLFISSMNTPRDLIAVEWFRVLATLNPDLVPHRVRSQPDHHGLGPEALSLGFGIAAVIAVVSLVLAAWALTGRMTRT